MKHAVVLGVSLLSLCTVLCPLPGFAQSDRAGRKEVFAYRGTWELGGTLGFLASTPVTNGSTGETGYTITATPYVGYFLFHGFELGANPLAVTWNREAGVTTTDLRMLATAGYNFFAGASLYPFLEGVAGYTRRETSSDGSTVALSGFTWGGRGGLKVALLEGSVLVLGGQYLSVTLSPAGADSRSGSNEFAAFAGWSVWF